MTSEASSSRLPSDSSTQPPQGPPPAIPLPPRLTFWYRVLNWPDNDAEAVTLDSTEYVLALRKALAEDMLDPFSPKQKVYFRDIEIWQVCERDSEQDQVIADPLTFS